jgi:hypothetical protein
MSFVISFSTREIGNGAPWRCISLQVRFFGILLRVSVRLVQKSPVRLADASPSPKTWLSQSYLRYRTEEADCSRVLLDLE